MSGVGNSTITIDQSGADSYRIDHYNAETSDQQASGAHYHGWQEVSGGNVVSEGTVFTDSNGGHWPVGDKYEDSFNPK